MSKSFTLDRRSFLGGLSLTVGGVAVSALLPLDIARASACDVPVVLPADPCGDWTIDDMCGAYPPYAHPIPYGRPRPAEAVAPQIAPEDLYFVT